MEKIEAIKTFEYKDDATASIFKHVSIIIFFLAFAIGAVYTLFQDTGSSIGSYGVMAMFLFFFVILMNAGVLKNMMDYHTLEIFNDHILINEEIRYPITEIDFQVKHGGGYTMTWTKGIITDLQGKVVGIYVFDIHRNSLFNISAQATKELIDNLKENTLQDYTDFLSIKKDELIEDHKLADKVGLYLSLIFIIPVLLALLIIYS